MDDTFYLTVNYRNKEIEFPAQFLRTGYSYRIQVDVYGTIISFEADEERNWRAIAEGEHPLQNKNINAELLQAIAHSLEDITK
jgi:hypothetical protein